jgi:hypothetical protein
MVELFGRYASLYHNEEDVSLEYLVSVRQLSAVLWHSERIEPKRKLKCQHSESPSSSSLVECVAVAPVRFLPVEQKVTPENGRLSRRNMRALKREEGDWDTRRPMRSTISSTANTWERGTCKLRETPTNHRAKGWGQANGNNAQSMKYWGSASRNLPFRRKLSPNRW